MWTGTWALIYQSFQQLENDDEDCTFDLGKGSEEKKTYFLWSFAKPGGGGVSEGSEKTIKLFWKSIFSESM